MGILRGPWYALAQPGPASAGPPDARLIEDLVVTNRILLDKGVIDIRGHVSVSHNRDSDRYLMSRAGAPELAIADDIFDVRSRQQCG
jgi:hypothetical protein